MMKNQADRKASQHFGTLSKKSQDLAKKHELEHGFIQELADYFKVPSETCKAIAKKHPDLHEEFIVHATKFDNVTQELQDRAKEYLEISVRESDIAKGYGESSAKFLDLANEADSLKKEAKIRAQQKEARDKFTLPF